MAVRMAYEDWRTPQVEPLGKLSMKQLLSIFIPSAGHKVKAKPKSEAEKDLAKQAQQVIMAKMKSQLKMIKAKPVKNGALKQGLSKGLSEEQISFQADGVPQSENKASQKAGGNGK